jgi:hypothetical protein
MAGGPAPNPADPTYLADLLRRMRVGKVDPLNPPWIYHQEHMLQTARPLDPARKRRRLPRVAIPKLDIMVGRRSRNLLRRSPAAASIAPLIAIANPRLRPTEWLVIEWRATRRGAVVQFRTARTTADSRFPGEEGLSDLSTRPPSNWRAYGSATSLQRGFSRRWVGCANGLSVSIDSNILSGT